MPSMMHCVSVKENGPRMSPPPMMWAMEVTAAFVELCLIVHSGTPHFADPIPGLALIFLPS
jgi:hypothetical protein